MSAVIFDRAALGSRRYAAYQWVLGEVRQFHVRRPHVLDFGSWDSPLPCQLALNGCRVIAVDRDNRFIDTQRELAQQFGVKYRTHWWNAGLDRHGDFIAAHVNKRSLHCVTSVFALEENVSTDTIANACRTLGQLVRDGGSFLVVGRYDKDSGYRETVHERTVTVLNYNGYREHVVEPSKCEVIAETFFAWDDLADTTEPCKASRANVIALNLRKKPHGSKDDR